MGQPEYEDRNRTRNWCNYLCSLFFAILLSIPVLLVAFYFIFRLPKADPKDVSAFFTNLHIIGHRGSPENFPENTMSSFKQALKEGVDGVEFDVSLTKDGRPILLHDDTLDRMTNMTGPIARQTLVDLENAYVGGRFNRTGPTEDEIIYKPIPKLETLIKWASSKKMRLIFDLKDGNEKLQTIISGLFSEYNLYNTSILASFSPSTLYWMKKSDPRYITVLTFRGKYYSTLYYESEEKQEPRSSGLWQKWLEMKDWMNMIAINWFLPSFLGVDGLLGYNRDINQLWINSQRSRGLHVMAWTVNELPEMLWMYETLKVPFLTDRPYLIDRLKEVALNLSTIH